MSVPNDQFLKDVARYKTGTTISLQGHNTKLQKMLPPRDCGLLLSRGPAFPAHSLDLSNELAEENHNRRSMHKLILERDPTQFRKRDLPESASGAVHQRQIMKDLLGEMHQLKDFGDIDKTKKFTRSILFEKEMQRTKDLDEYHFETMKPLDDFIRPNDQVSPRQTGYQPGHVRSILKLDTYGPAASASVNRERELGIKPHSPNIDRHSILSPKHQLRVAQGGAEPNRPDTANSTMSRASSANSTNYNGAFPSLKVLRRSRATTVGGRQQAAAEGLFGTSPPSSDRIRMNNTVAGGRASLQQRMGQSASAPSLGSQLLDSRDSNDTAGAGDAGVIFAGIDLGRDGAGRSTSPTSSVGGGSAFGGGMNNRAESRESHRSSGTGRGGGAFLYPEQTFNGVAITEKERMQGGDPFLRRTLWYKQYADSKKNMATMKQKKAEKKAHLKNQKDLADQERKILEEFEKSLSLAKFQA
mmetsp:Transcript_23978/g.39967  ORF Transcript_23978/g.39967 Transcript_23978/m.39967 type:complete len:471 (+) Transcript_23978:26-1438(+)